MKVVSYKGAADRIAWERELKRSAFRDEILSAVYSKLSQFEPNTLLNIRHPWKVSERFALRAWCPLHNGRWAKLIVRAAEDGHVTFECAAGCSQGTISDHIGTTCADADVPTSTIGESTEGDVAHCHLIEARHRFRPSQQFSGGDGHAA